MGDFVVNHSRMNSYSCNISEVCRARLSNIFVVDTVECRSKPGKDRARYGTAQRGMSSSGYSKEIYAYGEP